ncbi:hypothetical protein AOL_s00109g80 [Orbilia oligospora ATCC 24927]|uniref:Rab-GAP TBC domain-containing protein n=1 Tax=Arthrobotrys oligospora (strain ATCC 24927 / CBS 115.81 / DSM 1491) TaxID=756982 RepID=G1XK51_ARTOA|nr:hypothetical protein AOL_s00109g80 [Orbilia oligospora ATCC 24927]EGX46508.1 hypothetical protein AOL_s00109g80 [Orbilia oligospora ATCC 24927]
MSDEPNNLAADTNGNIDEKIKLEEDELAPVPGDPIVPKEEEDQNQDIDIDKEAKGLKVEALRVLCDTKKRDEIAALALSEHGLVNDEIRKRAWPILLGYDSSVIKTELEDAKVKLEDDKIILQDYLGRVPYTDLPSHRDEEQVALDVNRSFVYYPSGLTSEEMDAQKQELQDLIVEVLRRHPILCYFQGFHDICQVILLVLGPKLAPLAVEYMSLLRVRDFMLPALGPALWHLKLLHPILFAADEKLCRHLSTTQPFFALAATLTLYAHDIQAYGDIARLFDAFLAESPIFPIYFFATIVMSRQEELFDIPDTEPEMLHSILCKLPKPLDLEGLISKAIDLQSSHPPHTLGVWSKVPSSSVLKTYRSPVRSSGSVVKKNVKRDLLRGEALFKKQASQLSREQFKTQVITNLHTHKSMIGWTVLAGVSAIALGYYLGKRGLDTKSVWQALAVNF